MRIIFEQVLFPFFVTKYTCHVLHSFGYFGPIWGNFLKITTVHDVNYIDHPEDFTLISRLMTKILVNLSIRKSSFVVTDSFFSKQRLIHYYPHFKNKFVTIWPGIDEKFKQAIKKAKKEKKGKYVLLVSAFYPHKKVNYILDIWENLDTTYKLIVVGHSGSQYKNIKEKIKNLKRVSIVEKISLQSLSSLYKNALFVLEPSVYEGFGYAVYEGIEAKKNIVVGNSLLYHPKIRHELIELSFNYEQDQSLLEKMLANNKLAPVNTSYPESYQTSSKKLMNIYSKLFA